jgi:hypothetical protein
MSSPDPFYLPALERDAERLKILTSVLTRNAPLIAALLKAVEIDPQLSMDMKHAIRSYLNNVNPHLSALRR